MHRHGCGRMTQAAGPRRRRMRRALLRSSSSSIFTRVIRDDYGPLLGSGADSQLFNHPGVPGRSDRARARPARLQAERYLEVRAAREGRDAVSE